MVAVIGALLLPWAAAQTGAAADKHLAPGFTQLQAQDRVLLMPIDVELFSLSAGGVAEPRADWTETALHLMTEAIRARKREAKVEVVELKPEQADEAAELIGLHAAVAQSIALHQFAGSEWALPSKQGRLDWSFGDAMQPVKEISGARYALFVWVRDSYASAERKAAMVAMALLGVGLSGGVQIGYASLVELDTGRVVWFNLLARAYGDLREPKPARESIDALLTGFPGVR